MPRTVFQNYPRLKDRGLLDDSKLVQHSYRVSNEDLERTIVAAIITAQRKSSRYVLDLPEEEDEDTVRRVYKKEGQALFKYFQKYCGDPATTAYQCLDRHFSDVAQEQFRNRTLQQERMNSAWMYQFIAKDTAIMTKRFESVSDIGLREADFNVVIRYAKSESKLVIYVSVKNRSNTMGGQDWPKAIEALENEALNDRNRDTEYICVFGFSIERGLRGMRGNKRGVPYSTNTELWYSDFFWPFFTNLSYEEIAKAVLEVFLHTKDIEKYRSIEFPQELLGSFEACCREHDLIDDKGFFNDPFRLVELFCRQGSKRSKS